MFVCLLLPGRSGPGLSWVVGPARSQDTWVLLRTTFKEMIISVINTFHQPIALSQMQEVLKGFGKLSVGEFD